MPLFRKTNKDGFSLVETVASLSIMLVVIMLGMGGFMYMQKNQSQRIAQDVLDMDTHMAVMRLQQEMRLSSLDSMVFYPATAKKYTAVSFPLLRSGNPTEDADGKIVWDTTVVYYAYGSGDEMKLLRTEFSPRDNSLSVVDRQNQLASVIQNGSGSGSVNGNNSTTTCLFEHVFNWEIVPLGSSYDAYSPVEEVDKDASLGSFILSPGDHTLKLTATSKDSRSSGYRLGIDTIKASCSGLGREAERQRKAGSPNPQGKQNRNGQVRGGHYLGFEGNGIGDHFSLTLYNDRWEDCNFVGGDRSNTTVGAIDTSYDPSEFTLKLAGNTTNWSAKAQSRDGNLSDENDIGGTNWVNNAFFRGAIVRVLIRGQDLEQRNSVYADPLDHDGAGCRIAFKASDIAANGKDFQIRSAYIDTCVGTNITPRTEGHPVRITFNGKNYILIKNGKVKWSDIIDFPISWEKSYAVTFFIRADLSERIYPYIWHDGLGRTSSFMIPLSEIPKWSDLTATTWSSARMTNLPYIVAVDMLHTTYPQQGTYVSPAMDTLLEDANFESIDWTEDLPSGTQIDIKVRSADHADMSDAPGWDSISPVPSPGSLNTIAYKRYIQYQATLYSNDKGLGTPKLRDVSIQWPGETRSVNIGGAFVNGPDYGQFEATIDGQPLASPLRISIELLQTVRGFNNTMETLASKAMFELYPRNNGR